jgi:hypothetical protein
LYVPLASVREPEAIGGSDAMVKASGGCTLEFEDDDDELVFTDLEVRVRYKSC